MYLSDETMERNVEILGVFVIAESTLCRATHTPSIRIPSLGGAWHLLDLHGRIKVLANVWECDEVSLDGPVQTGGDDLVLVETDGGHDVLTVMVRTDCLMSS